MVKKRIMSIILTAVFGASLIVTPAFADGMKVSAPKYYRIEASAANDGYDAAAPVEAPVNGQFRDVVTWAQDDNYGPVYGNFISEVDVTGGSGKEVSLTNAVYDASGNLVDVSMDKKAAADASDTLSTTVAMSADQIFKTFIWNGSGLEPIEAEDEAPVILYFYCDDPNTVTIAWYNLGGNYTVWKNGTQVANPGLSSSLGWSYMGEHSGLVYTDTEASNGDTYVIKDGDVASETLTAHFEDGAYVTLGKYVSGRNMAYLRNDNAAWYHNSVSRHMNIEGTECDAAVYRRYEANNKTYEKWTNFYFKLDQDFISGSGNTVDVTIDYFDKGTDSIRIYYFPDSNPSSYTNTKVIDMEDTKTWKSTTYRLSAASFLANADPDNGNYQMRLMMSTGGAIAGVSVTPHYDTTITNLRAANTYTDGVELRWTVGSAAGITGYTIKRNGTAIATNYQHRTYYDTNLAEDTAYTYTVTAETAQGPGTESDALAVRTQSEHLASMTLPLSGASKTTYTDGGLSFWINTDDRWDFGFTGVVTRGGKECRSTYCVNRSNPRQGSLWYEYYTYDSGADRRASFMSFTVDNSIISADQRNVVIEFDYYDDPNSEFRKGQVIQVEYLKYNDGGTPTKGTVTAVDLTGAATSTWKTAKVVLTDAQFNHETGILDGGKNYDFRIGVGINRGGFASTNIKVYVPGAVAMPEHEISSEVNADGTALVGDIALDSSLAYDTTGSYDHNILFSGTAGRPAQDGSHYMYNQEYTEYGTSAWRRWQNSFYLKVPDSFLNGNDYEKVEIEVEYYAPTATGLKLLAKNSSGTESTAASIAATTGAWTTKVFTITPDSGYVFSNGYSNSADFRLTFDSAQGYIRKVTIRKDMLIED